MEWCHSRALLLELQVIIPCNLNQVLNNAILDPNAVTDLTPEEGIDYIEVDFAQVAGNVEKYIAQLLDVENNVIGTQEVE